MARQTKCIWTRCQVEGDYGKEQLGTIGHVQAYQAAAAAA